MTSLPNYEQKLRKLHPDAQIEREIISENLTRYRVVIAGIQCSESAIEDLAFKYALQDIETGLIKIPPAMGEQLNLEL